MSRAEAPASDRARTLVRGAFDLHVHSGPDVMPRKIDDRTLALRFRDRDLAGFLIKSHYVPTAERARIAREVVPEIITLGAITLNSAVGGLNPLAVEIAAREGASLVWMPTVDSRREAELHSNPNSEDKQPFWARLQQELRDKGVDSPTVDVTDSTGSLLPQSRAVLRTVAEYDMILATGHLGREEIFAVVEAAIEERVRRIVITHPDFPSQDLSVKDQAELAARGALLERCFVTAYTGKVGWGELIERIRATGPEHSFLSSDLGQPDNPAVEEGLALMADRLLEGGLTDDEIVRMAVENPARLVRGANGWPIANSDS
jgi:Family of unknown function (DUF6282)